MNSFADPKKMERLEQLFLKNYSKLKPVILSDAEQIESQKHAWGD